MRTTPVLVATALLVLATGCKKAYVCPEQKDTSQLEKWKDLGYTTDAPGIVVCEASEQNFNAAIPTPPAALEVATAIEARIKKDGWQDPPPSTFVPRTDENGVMRRFEKCGIPQNPLGERYVDCVGTYSFEVNVLPATLKGKPYLLWVDYRPDLHLRHPLPP